MANENQFDIDREMDALMRAAIGAARDALKQDQPNPAKAELAGRIIQACYGSQLNLELPGLAALANQFEQAMTALPSIVAGAMGRVPGSGLSDSEPIFEGATDPSGFDLARFMNILTTRIAHDAENGLAVDGAVGFIRESMEFYPTMREAYRLMLVLRDGETAEQSIARDVVELTNRVGRNMDTPEVRAYLTALREAMLILTAESDDAGTTTAPGDAGSAATAE